MMFQCVVCSHLAFPHFFKHMSGDLDQTFRLQSFFFPFSLHQSHWQILWSFLCADSQCQGTSLSWCWCLRASLILKSPLIPVPHTLVAFFSNKFSLGRCPWTFEPSQVPKWPSTLGLPVLLSWLLVVFRVRRKLLGTAWASFRSLTTYFLPFLLSLLQWGQTPEAAFPTYKILPRAAGPRSSTIHWLLKMAWDASTASCSALAHCCPCFVRDWTQGGVHARQALYQGAIWALCSLPINPVSPTVRIHMAHLRVTWPVVGAQ